MHFPHISFVLEIVKNDFFKNLEKIGFLPFYVEGTSMKHASTCIRFETIYRYI